MPKRAVSFTEYHYYHIFNRGTDKRDIFCDDEDMAYFLHRLVDFNTSISLGGVQIQNLPKYKKLLSPASKLVDIVAYCLLPNHFHFILKPLTDDGITRFMQRIGTGYVKYFNRKYQRSGSLFQGRFKATHISGYGALLVMSVYVNLNYNHHKINPDKHLVKTSFGSYIGSDNHSIICNLEDINIILDEIGGAKAYKQYAYEQSQYFLERRELLKDIEADS